MAPLLLAGFGIAFVVVVVRTYGVDVVPDSIGLGLYAFALWRLTARSRLFVVAAAIAGVGAVVALLDLAPGVLPDGADTVVVFAYNICVAASIGVGALALSQAARASGDRVYGQLRVVAGLTGIGLAAFVGGWATYPVDEGLSVLVLGLGQLVNIAAMIWYVVLLLVCSARDWAQPMDAAEAGTP